MSRAIVLVMCLLAAGGIALYTQYSRGDTGEPIYTVPVRSSQPAPGGPVSTAPAPKPIDPEDRVGLARALQRELKRVGCYSGDINGVWTTSSRMAMKAFVERVNATLPIDNPDPVLLSLVQAHQDRACGVACPAGHTPTGTGACTPNAVLAKGAKEPTAEARPDAGQPTAALTAAGAAAALTAVAPAAAGRGDAKADLKSEPRSDPRPEAKAAIKADPKAPVPDAGRSAASGPDGPVPSEGMRRPRRSTGGSSPQPPKIVRNFLRALGIKY